MGPGDRGGAQRPGGGRGIAGAQTARPGWTGRFRPLPHGATMHMAPVAERIICSGGGHVRAGAILARRCCRPELPGRASAMAGALPPSSRAPSFAIRKRALRILGPVDYGGRCTATEPRPASCARPSRAAEHRGGGRHQQRARRTHQCAARRIASHPRQGPDPGDTVRTARQQ